MRARERKRKRGRYRTQRMERVLTVWIDAINDGKILWFAHQDGAFGGFSFSFECSRRERRSAREEEKRRGGKKKKKKQEREIDG